MKKLASLILALGLILAVMAPAEARVAVFVGGGYYGPYYPGYGYYPYYPSYYYPPPPVVYAAPAPVTYAAPPPVVAATPTLNANQTSATFIDSQGRTCRQFQTTAGVGPPTGVACLMPNGTWQTVQ
jgi:hypothetical protein